jgi:ribosomal RNA-processing protein 36
VVQVPKKVARDPRFDEKSGHFNSGLFSKAYSFLDEYKTKEKQALQRELKKTKDKNRKEEISATLKDIEKTEEKQAHTKTAKETERVLKKDERKLVRQGKKPFYLKKSDQKKLALAEKFLELKTKGKLDKFMAKRRKRTTAKERRYLPYRRR